jgi:hypothetical protein
MRAILSVLAISTTIDVPYAVGPLVLLVNGDRGAVGFIAVVGVGGAYYLDCDAHCYRGLPLNARDRLMPDFYY